MMKTIPIALLLSAFLLTPAFSEPAPKDEPKVIKNDAGQAIEYQGVLTAKQKRSKQLAEHRVITRHKGSPYQVCRGCTGKCPERCGASGEYATFKVTQYLHYQKPGEYGDDKLKEFRIQISDFHKKETGDKLINSVIKGLKKGDLVVLEEKHLYGEYMPGVFGPVRPLMLLKKITKEEAKALIAKEVDAAEAK